MHSKFLSLMLMALVFIVACAAAPTSSNSTEALGRESTRPVPDVMTFDNTTLASERITSRAMGCKSSGYVKYCTDQGSRVTAEMYFEAVNEHFENDLPNWKKTNNYLFCFDGKCGAMATLSGSQFIPANYKHVAKMAVRDKTNTVRCKANGWNNYPMAIDIYYYEYNFVFSWFFNSPKGGTCTPFPENNK